MFSIAELKQIKIIKTLKSKYQYIYILNCLVFKCGYSVNYNSLNIILLCVISAVIRWQREKKCESEKNLEHS